MPLFRKTLLYVCLVSGQGFVFAGCVNGPDAQHVISLASSRAPAKVEWFAAAGPISPVQVMRRFSQTGRLDIPGLHPIKVPGNVAGTLPAHAAEAWLMRIVSTPVRRSEPWAVRIGRIDDRDRTYWNGRLIGTTGKWDAPRAQAYDRPRLYLVPNDSFAPNGNLLMIHVQTRGSAVTRWGLSGGPVEFGPATELSRRAARNGTVRLLLLAVYLTAGVYFLFLFLRRRSERSHLFFGLFTSTLVAYQFLRTPFKFDLGVSFFRMKQLEYALLFVLVPLFYYFLRFYFRIAWARWGRHWSRLIDLSVVGIALCVAIVFSTDSAVSWSKLFSRAVQPLWGLQLIGCTAILVRMAMARNIDAYLILAGFATMVLSLLNDVLAHRGLLPFPRVSEYTFATLISGTALILANRFVRLHKSIADLNQNLERKVDQRTRGLYRALERVKALKSTQDGDYFLTAQLLTPLSGNSACSELVRFEYLVQQKKRFRFRTRRGSIGGDLVHISPLQLRDAHYTAFINADAMGKSIQGAGGAMIIGVVWKSILTRTQATARHRSRYPEQWLKEAYLDIHTLLVAMDGLMMGSAVLGLVDEYTGTVLYINAEHPAGALYRNGRAGFVKEIGHMPKMGMQGAEQTLYVQSLALRPGDALFFGSDGRDDVRLFNGTAAAGEINTDDERFLRIIEEADGDLDAMRKFIGTEARFIDDLSIIRISVPASNQSIVESDSPQCLDILREAQSQLRAGLYDRALQTVVEARNRFPAMAGPIGAEARLLKRIGRFFDAGRLLEVYLRMRPSDSRAILLASEIKIAQGADAEAVDLGERYLLRKPDDTNARAQLARVYGRMGNAARAGALLSRQNTASRDGVRGQG